MKGNKAILTCLVGLAWQCSSRAEAAPSYPNFPSRSAAAQALERRKQELFARAREEQESTLAAARAAATSIANQAAAEFETQRNALTQQAAERRQLLALEARERIAREQERAFLLLSTAANSANAAVDRIG